MGDERDLPHRARLMRRVYYGSLYVMQTKMTLRLDDALIRRAKAAAKQRGKSVSQLVAEYFESLGREHRDTEALPPVTASLVGILNDPSVDIEDYKKHVEEKHR